MDPAIASSPTPTTASSPPSTASPPAAAAPRPPRALHPKRSFASKHAPMAPHHLHPQPLDSPAYDASEEDNDPLTDSGASFSSVPARTRIRAPPAAPVPRRHALAAALLSSDDGVDSPTYDGDVESSTTAGPDTPFREHYASSASTASPVAPPAPSPPALRRPTPAHPSRPTEPEPASGAPLSFDPAKLSPEDIQAWFQEMIDGPGCKVGDAVHKINPPPRRRPVRIYADGVYDLFHFGHALQLRQAKLAFPSVPPDEAGGEWTPGVYLLVGVNSDAQCEAHKNRTVMTHAERCEAVRHCRWVDEIVPEAPWIIDSAFLTKYSIDYVAHDVDPYGSAGHSDVYAFCKTQGRFLPTRRTPGISTSDLLARLVAGYRLRVFDAKLAKMGMHRLMAEGSDWDESVEGSRVGSRAASPPPVGERERVEPAEHNEAQRKQGEQEGEGEGEGKEG